MSTWHQMNILDLAREAGIEINHPCNGKGTCGKCKVRILSGSVLPPSEPEEKLLSAEDLSDGIRLACYTEAAGEIRFEAIGQTNTESFKILEAGFSEAPKLDRIVPFVRKTFINLDKPSLEDNRSDVERVTEALKLSFHSSLLPHIYRKLPEIIAASGYAITVVESGGEIIGLEAGNTGDRLFGVAVDIGTTTVVVSIVDLHSGSEIAWASEANDQRSYGQDVISRIQFGSETPGNLVKLQKLIAEQINRLIVTAAVDAKVSIEELYAVSVAANTSMLHLLLGIDGGSLTVSPYNPVFLSVPLFPAKNVGVRISDFGLLLLIPSVSSYVGGDIVAGVLATGMDKTDENTMLIDIGTNGEIIYGNKNGFVACSCAAGPAFEGMNIECGTIAVNGAIESVQISDGEVSVAVIGDKPPLGICGSGIVDAVAQLYKNGIFNKTGRFPDALTFAEGDIRNKLVPFFRTDKGLRFVIGTDKKGSEIFISQKDVRQVQLAKAAIASAIKVLLQEAEISVDEISKVYIAGGFGKHLRLESLIDIGLIPKELNDRVVFAGNTAKSGAVRALLAEDALKSAEEVRRKTVYHELSVYPGYEEIFLKDTLFPVISRV